jgi:hypothetical protein
METPTALVATPERAVGATTNIVFPQTTTFPTQKKGDSSSRHWTRRGGTKGIKPLQLWIVKATTRQIGMFYFHSKAFDVS